MLAYCLFCETQRCRQIAEHISKNHKLACISPVILQRKWVRGIPAEEAHDWLPGYLFLYSDVPLPDRFDVSGIIRILGNGPLTGQDLRFAEMIYQRNGVMGSVPLIQEGTRCRISDPAWAGLSGRVIRMDRERKRCCIEYEFDGIPRTIWAGYEIIENEA